MKRTFQAGILAAVVLAFSLPVSAHQYQRNTDGHILRILAHAGHALGIGLEYGVTRPIHWAASQDNLDIVLGHKAYLADDATHFEWSHGDHTPSIAVERAAKSKTSKKMVK